MTSVSDRVIHLRSLTSIRERCAPVFKLAQEGKTEYFDYEASKEKDVIDYCASIMERDFGTNFAAIPPHGRWRHFDVGPLPRITTLLSKWGTPSAGNLEPVPPMEAARKLVDLFVVSVLLDAGAGTKWQYEEKATGLRIGRSEGLAIASLDMFTEGLFCGLESPAGEDPVLRCQVDAIGLARLSTENLAMSMQVHPEQNPMTGLDGRAQLLIQLSKALTDDSQGYFTGAQQNAAPRPGNMVDWLLTHPSTAKDAATGAVTVQVSALWEVLIIGLAPIWPATRTKLDGVSLGDVWPCDSFKAALGDEAGVDDEKALVPFHKLTQWLCYSIMEPIEQTLGWTFAGGEHQTGLPEYRNGGLLVDLGVLKPKAALYKASEPPTEAPGIPRLLPSHPAVVEWRALTVILLDRIAEGIRQKYGLTAQQLNLKQVLEAATWKGGREIAKQKRPETGGPPIDIISDGTVF
ncbi:DUF1688-domain-containing protein [Tilletiaria anomala UBC 951]|uniref:DUF1688-domain-containing protein n=1 Tax=Tilletiaria anomala (strain ATCC 24038 / CBS 436.72 / UBC 951) TaxID=1037660 RepID=A0A066W6T4_TILAU|nr:DUF1688-domain-containing protein [Tilletiaria anomala UBC 951]KDN46485.1 DUF1688-domain-containing protein [Tilletiaria anomala UBC 951]